MCNCGNKRNAQQQEAQFLSGPVSAKINKSQWPDIKFEYAGKTGLSVTGGITGKKYRFNHPGDIQLIDYRDASGMMAVPSLKKATGKE